MFGRSCEKVARLIERRDIVAIGTRKFNSVARTRFIQRYVAARVLAGLRRLDPLLTGFQLEPLKNRLKAIREGNLPDLSDDRGLDPPE